MGIERERGFIIARKLNEPIATGCALLRDAVDLAGGILDPDDPGQLGKRAHGVGHHVDDGPAGDSVDHDRQIAAVMQGCVMRDHPGLGWLVVIGCHDKGRVGPDLLGKAHQRHAFDGVVRPGPSNDRHAAAGGFHHHFDHGLVLVMGKRRAFPGGSDRHKAGGAFGDLPFDQVFERIKIQLAVFERRHQGWNGPFDHDTSPILGGLCAQLRTNVSLTGRRAFAKQGR